MKNDKALYTKKPTQAIEWGIAFICMVGIAAFFQYGYRAVLCHREQFSLFLMTAETFTGYMKAPAGLARLLGDFLTQFLCFSYVGPLIVAAILTLTGVLAYRVLKPLVGVWAWAPAVALTVVELCRQCGLTYPLSSTLQWTGWLAMVLVLRGVIHRWGMRIGVARCGKISICLVTIGLLAGGVWLFGWGDWQKRQVTRPSSSLEKILALDCATYYGDMAELERLLHKHDGSTHVAVSYYRNLSLTRTGRMGDALMQHYQPSWHGLFLEVNNAQPYYMIYAANEMWFLVGDMTNAEHAAMLGMIFSPRSTGARPLMRLAEISLINGDEEAAMKYLRMLEKTIVYRRWARNRMPGNTTPQVKQWLERKRQAVVHTDMVRMPFAPMTSLRHLLDNNPSNTYALQYLLACDLLTKNLQAFVQDYQQYYPAIPPQRVWAEALLIDMAMHGTTPEEIAARQLPKDVVDDFVQYTEQWNRAKGEGTSLQASFGQSYWFYWHFAQIHDQDE